ncbi:hypothetical protein [Streptomyces sp. NPDC050738]|uniref:hypothetical protein n=1 Tax=Streptomyces sp. NPDC050738 TaxID=3154744 RepID=UPI0034182169
MQGRYRAWPFVIPPFDRLYDFPDEDGIEPDARADYTPVHRLYDIRTADNGHLATDIEIYGTPET